MRRAISRRVSERRGCWFKRNVAGLRGQRAVEAAQERAFPRTVGAEKTGDGAWRKFQTDVAQDRIAGAIGKTDVPGESIIVPHPEPPGGAEARGRPALRPVR